MDPETRLRRYLEVENFIDHIKEKRNTIVEVGDFKKDDIENPPKGHLPIIVTVCRAAYGKKCHEDVYLRKIISQLSSTGFNLLIQESEGHSLMIEVIKNCNHVTMRAFFELQPLLHIVYHTIRQNFESCVTACIENTIDPGASFSYIFGICHMNLRKLKFVNDSIEDDLYSIDSFISKAEDRLFFIENDEKLDLKHRKFKGNSDQIKKGLQYIITVLDSFNPDNDNDNKRQRTTQGVDKVTTWLESVRLM